MAAMSANSSSFQASDPSPQFPSPVEVFDWVEAGEFSVDSGTAAIIPASVVADVLRDDSAEVFVDAQFERLLRPEVEASGLVFDSDVLVCRSGLGDGVYPVWRGDSADGVPVAVELQFLPLGDEPFVTVGSFTVSGPFVVSDPAYVGFGAGLTTSVDWLPAGEYLVQVAVQELEFWGRRVSAVSLVSPVS